MKRFTTLCCLTALAALLTVAYVLPAHSQPPGRSTVVKPIKSQSKVEVVFVLDTTGSMGGLIDGAKKKIWSIVNEIATAKPAPIVKIGFVIYRDKGDAYVTKVYDLKDDLDAAFADLQTFEAGGGGDAPEHVSKGLSDGVNQIKWSRPGTGASNYQVIFLVGDCPPHTDYQDGFDYRKHAQQAADRGIVINTIRCGNDGSTETYWREIAKIGKGDYFSIAQSGGVVSIPTPYDTQIGKLADKLEGTTVAQGGALYESRQRASSEANAALPAASKADRASFNAKSAQVYGSWDIVARQMSGKVNVETMKDEDLPENMRKMSKPQRKKYIDGKIAERKQTQTQLSALEKQRAAYLRTHIEKNQKGDSFDALVKRTIVKQGRQRGLKY